MFQYASPESFDPDEETGKRDAGIKEGHIFPNKSLRSQTKKSDA